MVRQHRTAASATPPAEAIAQQAVARVPGAGGPLLLTCEHASARVPSPLAAGPQDEPWLGTHWAVDLGAARVTRELARITASPALLARFSRLVCDANRAPDAEDLIVTRVEGHALSFNRGLDPAQRQQRLARWYEPYHQAVDQELLHWPGPGRGPTLLSVHSFTPVFNGQQRPMELGVLFDHGHPALAARLLQQLKAAGFSTVANEPYSGYEGLIHSAWRHGRKHRVPYLELEIRQDLINTAASAERLARQVAAALAQITTA